jgi:hypothetical protein
MFCSLFNTAVGKSVGIASNKEAEWVCNAEVKAWIKVNIKEYQQWAQKL